MDNPGNYSGLLYTDKSTCHKKKLFAVQHLHGMGHAPFGDLSLKSLGFPPRASWVLLASLSSLTASTPPQACSDFAFQVCQLRYLGESRLGMSLLGAMVSCKGYNRPSTTSFHSTIRRKLETPCCQRAEPLSSCGAPCSDIPTLSSGLSRVNLPLSLFFEGWVFGGFGGI